MNFAIFFRKTSEVMAENLGLLSTVYVGFANIRLASNMLKAEKNFVMHWLQDGFSSGVHLYCGHAYNTISCYPLQQAIQRSESWSIRRHC